MRVVSAQSVIAAMITPALLILGSASLIATALVRLARVVDRSRALVAAVESGTIGDPAEAARTLERNAVRAAHVERSVAVFFAAVILFVCACLCIGLNEFAGNRFVWLPIALVIAGMGGMIAGAGYMVAETRLGLSQILEEIQIGRQKLETRAS